MKKFLAVMLALVLCLSCFATAEEVVEAAPFMLGGKMDDFTVTTWDGKTLTLSEVLKEKDMVLINLWATWCGPCRSEFPFMEEAYEQYKDQIEVIALSVEPTDTPDVLAAFTAEQGMTFPVGQDLTGLMDRTIVDGEYANGIPTTLVVDRFGTICFAESGSMPSTGAFTRLFDVFVGDDYTESVILEAVPPLKPTVAPSAEADVAAALNVEGGAIAFTNPTGEYDWPMTVSQDGDRSVVVSSNVNVDESSASVNFTVTANAGDVLAYDFKVSSEAACDMLNLYVNGEVKKVFSGEKGWMTYGYQFAEAGTYEITLAYVKDMMSMDGADLVMLDNVCLVSGDAAAAVLAGNPQYPASTATTEVTVVNGKQMTYQESVPDSLLMNFGELIYYVVDGPEVTMSMTLAEGVDPEGAFVYSGYDGSQTALADAISGNAYVFTSVIDSTATTGYSYTPIYLYEDVTSMNVVGVMLFASEEEANAFMDYCNMYGLGLTGWTYADGTLPSTDARPEEQVATSATYTFTCVDQNGDPVTGVMINVCTDESCTPMPVDENGVLSFESMPYEYHIQVILVPDGYEFDKTQEFYTTLEGGEMVLTMTKQ